MPAVDTLPALRCGLVVEAGELLLIRSPSKRRTSLLVDLLLGLGGAGGEVDFLGHPWAGIPWAEANRLRSQVARLSGRGDWIETRSVLENLLLPLRHHTTIPDDRLRARASDTARRFGLPGIPTQLPGECLPGDLLRAGLVRAFLGRPRLVILEHPLKDEGRALLPMLIEGIREVRQRGGAVLWFTRDKAIVYDQSIPADHRYQIAGSQMLKLDQAR